MNAIKMIDTAPELDGQYIKLMMMMMRKLGIERVELTLAEIEAFNAQDERDGMWAVVSHMHRDSIELLCMPLARAELYASLADAAPQGNG